jgi:hypothetical protein
VSSDAPRGRHFPMKADLALRPAGRRRFFVVLTALMACSPFSPALYLPDDGTRPWSELTTRHFILYTDLSRDLAQERIRRLEVLRSVLEEVAFPSSEERGETVAVIAFRRARDYEAIAPFGTDGVFMAVTSDPEAPPTILVSAQLVFDESRDTMPPVIDRCPSRASKSPSCWASHGSTPASEGDVERRFVHELVHELTLRSFGDTAPWLNEGLAQYFSTLRLEDGRAVLGAPVPGATAVPASLLPSVRDLTNADESRFESTDVDRVTAARYYAGAWVLVHMLHNGPERYRARFQILATALKDGRTTGEAWHAATAGIDAETLQSDYAGYARTAAWRLIETRAAASSAPVVEAHSMTSAEVRSLWSRVARPSSDESSP